MYNIYDNIYACVTWRIKCIIILKYNIMSCE